MDELQSNKDNQDEALVWQMRCLTANYLESHKDYFEPFLQIPYEKLITEVLTMGKEADGLGVGPLQVVLKVKINIVTIDRNHSQPLSFEQMKITGKCPVIYTLYKPGHYDIIYSKEQSNIDGFDTQSQSFTGNFIIPQGYSLHNIGQPFFVEIPQTGESCPSEEFKDFQIMVDVPYKSTSQQQINIAQPLKKCEKCTMELEQQMFVKLSCNHEFCKECLSDRIHNDTNGKIFRKQNDNGKKATCYNCTYTLNFQEIEKCIGQEKCRKAREESSR